MSKKLAELMFPHLTLTPAALEERYPPRTLAEAARVTRIAPSPTGYLHLGVLFTAMVNRLVADASGGVFFLRLEDTDQKREVAGGACDILEGLTAYGVAPDEGMTAPDRETGEYGPYRQSERVAIYHAYVHNLVSRGLAYPCFCSEAERTASRTRQEQAKERTGYYGKFAVCRDLDPAMAIEQIQQGRPYVVRLRSPGSEHNRFPFDDLIKGRLELPENDEDIVLLKSDGIPTYHFAHVVDDHLMRTTHVIRGDEWISSLPKHIQLFRMLDWRPPKYAHVSPIMREDNGGKRKLSKRKDPEAAMRYYTEQGYPADSVMEYLMTVASSEFEDWRRQHPGESRARFPFNLKKMSVSGALFDPDKLTDVSKTVIAGLSAHEVAGAVTGWAERFDKEYSALFGQDIAYTQAIFTIDRGGAKPRKDIAKWSDAPEYAAYFFDETFVPDYTLPDHIRAADAGAVLRAYAGHYDPALEQADWFAGIKALCPALGFCPEVKEYKKNPQEWKGHVGDVTTILRIAVTGRRNTPDLCAIMRLLGRDRVLARLEKMAAAI